MQLAIASEEIAVLGWSVAFLLAHVLIQAVSLDLAGDLSIKYLLGPRDEQRQTASVLAGRLQRALHNFLETYPAFIALALALAVTGKVGGIGGNGAWVWLIARLAYLGLYVTGVPVLRTIVWFISMLGIVLMLIELMT
ncbi:hypothetical protein BCY90_15815 [Agrobacterium deltaense]|uniref:MAPEG family protein n=1 Tax=Agrobacterium TaxID=357 RepID=UPI00074597B8|nr:MULTISPECIES: MAPEG family protein [Agrobacterium]KVK54287.1 hypothetical protein L901_18120 [Agrobacterium sp. D14]RKF41779.1 hypothetical protein BCY90_15815 [Agrobacterium deltaense]